MVRPDVFRNKIARARHWVAEAEPVLCGPTTLLQIDGHARDLACFYLFLAVQECIDIAAHWVVDDALGTPDDAAGTFEALSERGLVSDPTALAMRGAVGLRNRIAHGYSTVDFDRLRADASRGIPAVRDFLASAARRIGE